ncbi:hypothetical protein [Paenibacillus eucommiae]|uniref:Uncharacterized protein n=1 Tax=Paenibacillus eucommiae TaxID=1355755 RepID=A0ABS4IUU9_9BACL|nr:hypothetical protein [Paenibacillus eucommiae]MBP1991355.1 hypothetical protein [Paenibacillus eucommiae]
MKIIVKNSRSFSDAQVSSSQRALARQEISSNGYPFELGVRVVRVVRAIVDEKREWLWVEER